MHYVHILEDNFKAFYDVLGKITKNPILAAEFIENLTCNYKDIEKAKGITREIFMVMQTYMPTFVQRITKIKDGKGEMKLYIMPTQSNGELLTNLTGAFKKTLPKENWRENMPFDMSKPTIIKENKAKKYVNFVVLEYEVEIDAKGKIKVEESTITARDFAKKDEWKIYIRWENDGNIFEGTINGYKKLGMVNGKLGEFPKELEMLRKKEFTVKNPKILVYKNGKVKKYPLVEYAIELWAYRIIGSKARKFTVNGKNYVIFRDEIIREEEIARKARKYLKGYWRNVLNNIPKATEREIVNALDRAYFSKRIPRELREYARRFVEENTLRMFS